MNVPILETERLRLRGHRKDDLPARLGIWSDPEVVRYISGVPETETSAWGKMLSLAGLWPLLGYGYWVVEEKATGRMIGEVGFADFRREMVPPTTGTPELGWVLAPEAHGKGYATEAARAALEWGDANFSTPKTCCIIDPRNLASIRVAEKTGFKEVCRTSFRGEPTVLFARG